jgi:uncharacterized protein
VLTKRQAAVDVALTVALVPFSAAGAAVLVALLSSGPPNLVVAVTFQALLSLAGVHLLLTWREQSWSAIGLVRPRAIDLARGALILLVGFAINAALAGAVVALSPQTLEEHIEGLRSIASGLTADTPLSAALALLLLVGFYEEIVSRGLLLRRSRRLLGGTWAPALFSAALFALGHFYQGPYGVLQTALFGLVLAVFTIRWGTLWPAIVAHAAINMLSLVQLGEFPAVR